MLKKTGYYRSTMQYSLYEGKWYVSMEYMGTEPCEGCWFHREGEPVNDDVYVTY